MFADITGPVAMLEVTANLRCCQGGVLMDMSTFCTHELGVSVELKLKLAAVKAWAQRAVNCKAHVKATSHAVHRSACEPTKA